MLNLDTHILIYALTATLKPREQKLLSTRPWGISAIVLWELTQLAQLGRIELDLEAANVRRLLARLHVWPIDLQVCRAMTRLDFRSDPADELIAATSLAHGVPLLTRDAVLRASKVVPLA